MSKDELRSYIRERFRKTTDEQRKHWSEEFCCALSKDKKIMDAKYIMAFHPMKDEVNIVPLLKKLQSEGKKILLPVVVDGSRMTLRLYEDDNSMTEGVLGILNPTGQDFTDYDKIDVILVPGMAFDKDGHRLGRGKGYYDRFFCKLNNIYTKAVYFPYQIVDKVPVEPHDTIIDNV